MYENPDSSDSFPITITFMARSELEQNSDSKAYDEINGVSSLEDNLQVLKLVDCQTDVLPPYSSEGDNALDFRTMGYHGSDHTFSWQAIGMYLANSYQESIVG